MSESLDSSGFLPPPTLRRPHISNWAAAVEHSLRALEGSGPHRSPPAPQPLLRGMASPGGSGRVDQPPEDEGESAAPGLTELLEAVTRGGSVRQSPGMPPSHGASYGHAGAVDVTTPRDARMMPTWTAPAAVVGPPDDAEELSIDSRAATPRRADTDVPGRDPYHGEREQNCEQHERQQHCRQNQHNANNHTRNHHHRLTPAMGPMPSSTSGGRQAAPSSGLGRANNLSGGANPVEPVQGRLFALACDAEGSRIVQRMLDSQLAVAAGCDELHPHLSELLCHPYGNYAVQRVLEHGDVPERMRVAEAMRGRAVELALDVYGCRVLQRLLDTSVPTAPPGPQSVDAALVALVVALLHELDGHLDRIICDQNGNHVAQKILDCAPPHVYPTAFLVRAFCNNMPSLGRHCYGCRVAQKVFEVCGDGTSMLIPESRHAMDRLLHVVYDHLPILVADQYGNYVVQHMIANATPLNRSHVIARLAPEIGVLACDKFGSNVAERVLRCASDAERDGLVDILVTPAPVPTSSQGRTSRLSPAAAHAAAAGRFVAPIALLMHDQFANYVVQRIIELATRPQQQRLVEAICAELDLVRSTTFGQHLLLRLERLAWMPPGVSGLSPSSGPARGPTRDQPGDLDVPTGQPGRQTGLRYQRQQPPRDERGGRGRHGGRGQGTASGNGRGSAPSRDGMGNQNTYDTRYIQDHGQPQQQPPHQQIYHSSFAGVSSPPVGDGWNPHYARALAAPELPSGAAGHPASYGYSAASDGYTYHDSGVAPPLPRHAPHDGRIAGGSGVAAAAGHDLARIQAAEMLRQHNPDVDLNSEAVALVAAALMMTQKPTLQSGVASVPPHRHDPYAWRGRR